MSVRDQMQVRLLERRRILLRAIKDIKNDVLLGGPSVECLLEECDHSSSSSETLDLSENTRKRELKDIEHALTRINDGNYRQCTGCGQCISLIRLRLLPTAVTCFACREAQKRSM